MTSPRSEQPGRRLRPDRAATARTRCSPTSRRALRLRARRLPGAGLPRARGRHGRAGRGADRLRQDDRRRVRRAPGARAAGASASTPRRSRRCRTRSSTTWSRRYGADKVGLLTGDNTHQRRGAGRGDDHRGAPQHAVRRLATLHRARLRRDGRGALPRRPDPRRGVGGGDHPPARVGGAGLAVRDRVATPRSSASGSATVRGETTTIVEERRPVPLYQHVMVGRRMYDLFADEGGRPGGARPDARSQGQPASCCGWPATTGRAAACSDRRTPKRGGQRGRGGRPAATAGVWVPSRAEVVERLDRAGAAARDRVHLQPGRLRRGGPAVPERQPAADHARGARRDLRVRRGALRRHPGRGPAGARLPRVPRRADPRRRRPPRRHAADVQGVRRGAVPARPVPGRVRHRDAGARASTCRPARW